MNIAASSVIPQDGSADGTIVGANADTAQGYRLPHYGFSVLNRASRQGQPGHFK
jgi:hypothetical protein